LNCRTISCMSALDRPPPPPVKPPSLFMSLVAVAEISAAGVDRSKWRFPPGGPYSHWFCESLALRRRLEAARAARATGSLALEATDALAASASCVDWHDSYLRERGGGA